MYKKWILTHAVSVLNEASVQLGLHHFDLPLHLPNFLLFLV